MLREKVKKAWVLILIQQRSYKENHNVLSRHIRMCVYAQTYPIYIYVFMYMNGVSMHTLTHAHTHPKWRIVRNFAQTSLFCDIPFPWWKPTIVSHLHWWSSWVKKLETGTHSLFTENSLSLSKAHLTRPLVHIVFEQKWSVQEWKTESSLSTGSLVFYTLTGTWSCGRSAEFSV